MINRSLNSRFALPSPPPSPTAIPAAIFSVGKFAAGDTKDESRRVLRRGGRRAQALQAYLRREGSEPLAAPGHRHREVAGGGFVLWADGAHGLRGGLRPGDRGQPRPSELPAARPWPVRPPCSHPAAHERAEDGPRLLSWSGFRVGEGFLACPLRDEEPQLRLPRRRPNGRTGDARHCWISVVVYLDWWHSNFFLVLNKIWFGWQGSVLGAEIKVSGKSYSTQIMPVEQAQDMEKTSKSEKGSILKPHIFSVTVPQVARFYKHFFCFLFFLLYSLINLSSFILSWRRLMEDQFYRWRLVGFNTWYTSMANFPSPFLLLSRSMWIRLARRFRWVKE